MRASQRSGSSSSAQRRQRLGRGPDAVERRRRRPRLDDRVAEALAHLVLAHLHLQAEQLLEQRARRRAARAPAVQRVAQRVEVGQRRRADRVHHVLGVALETAIVACMRSRIARRSRARDERRDEAALAQPLDQRAQVVGATAARQRAPRSTLDVDASASSSRSRPPRCVAQPRHARELHGVGHLVEGDPAQRAARVDVEVARPPRAGSARRTAGAAGARGRAATSSYWPSTRCDEQAGQAADLGGEQQRRRAARSGRAAGCAAAPRRAVGDRVEHLRACRRGSRRPTPGGRPPRARGSGAARRAAPCRRRRAARRRRHRDEVAGQRDAWALGPRPAARRRRARQSIIGARRAGTARAAASASSVMRAATTGECGSRSSGAPSGSSKAGNATSPPPRAR